MRLPSLPQAIKWLRWLIQIILPHIPPPPVLHLAAAVAVLLAHECLCVVYVALALAETRNGHPQRADPNNSHPN